MQRNGFSAAAGANLVGVVEDKTGGQLVLLEIHFGAKEKQHRPGVDGEADALVLDHFIARCRAGGDFHGIGHAGAAAVPDADTQRRVVPTLAGQHLAHARGGGLGQLHHLRCLFHLHCQKNSASLRTAARCELPRDANCRAFQPAERRGLPRDAAHLRPGATAPD